MVRPSELRKKILSLAARREKRFMELASALNMYHDISPSKFREVVEEAGMGSRKAYCLCEIYGNFRPLFRSGYRERLDEIGWAKAYAIAKGVTKENAKERLEKAEEKQANGRKLTVRELQAFIDTGSAPKTHCVVLYFAEKEFEKFKAAVEDHGGPSPKARRALLHKEKAIMKLIDEVGAKKPESPVATSTPGP